LADTYVHFEDVKTPLVPFLMHRRPRSELLALKALARRAEAPDSEQSVLTYAKLQTPSAIEQEVPHPDGTNDQALTQAGLGDDLPSEVILRKLLETERPPGPAGTRIP